MTKHVFIGGGNMATAIVGGLIEQGMVPAQLCVTDPSSERLASLAKTYAVSTQMDNLEAIAQADVIVLAVKPQVMQSVCRQLAQRVQERQPLVISIAAGLPAELIEEWLGGPLPLVRVMPNTPAMVGMGASGLWANERVSREQQDLAEAMFAAVGRVQVVDSQDQLHAITAISGSGPAYFYLFMEAMIAKAQDLGFDAEQAQDLVCQTAMGAAQMVQQFGNPGQLKQNVMSPGGTTEQAIARFEQDGLRNLVNQALDACHARSIELGQALAQSTEE